MLRWERDAVHLVRQKHLVPHRLRRRKAALVVVLVTVLHAVVRPGEHDLDRLVGETGLTQDRRERGADPGRGADRFEQPRLADGTGLEPRAAVPRALERTVCVTAGRARTSAIDSRIGERTSPPTSTSHSASSASGMSKWINR